MTTNPEFDFEYLSHLVENWAGSRGIYDHSTPQAQLLKAFSEMGELADAIIKNDLNGELDAVGDVMVCLINYCALRNLNLTWCLNHAWEQIKDRKGRMVPGGAFVKDEA